MVKKKAKIKDLYMIGERCLEITLEISSLISDKEYGELEKFNDYNTLLDISICKSSLKRSIDANAYFHLLCQKLAHCLECSLDEVKHEMVIKYGTISVDENNNPVIAILPLSANINQFYKYTRKLQDCKLNGEIHCKYMFYKQTSELNSKEFYKLLKGLISECKEFDIETATPDELAKMMSLMQQDMKSIA